MLNMLPKQYQRCYKYHHFTLGGCQPINAKMIDKMYVNFLEACICP